MDSVLSAYKRFSVRVFGSFADKNKPTFSVLKTYLLASDTRILLRTWVSLLLMTTFLVFISSIAGVAIAHVILGFDMTTFMYYMIFIPVFLSALCFLMFYVYPIQKSKSISKSIENNLPFALAHMNAISSSGIPPEFMFELLTNFREYGAIAAQSAHIIKNIKGFGMSSVDSLNNVAKRTPSPSFKQVLTGISSTIEKGGDLSNFLEEMSEKSLFEYRLKREKFLKTLSSYADIYTAFLITAPLLMLSALVMMSLVGGSVLGLTAADILFFITWLGVPAMNVCFLAFVHFTYPGT